MDTQKLLEAIKKENRKTKDETVKELKGYVGEEIDKLATMTQKGFLEVGGRMDKLDGRMDGLDGRMDGLEGGMGELKVGMKNLHKRMNVLDDNQEEIKTKLDGLAYRFELEELRVQHSRRLRALELKVGIKPA